MGGNGTRAYGDYAGEGVSIYQRLQREGVAGRMQRGREGEGYMNGSGSFRDDGIGQDEGGYAQHDLLNARYQADTNGYSQQGYDEERYGEGYHPRDDEWEEPSPPQLVLDPSLEEAGQGDGKMLNGTQSAYEDHRAAGPTFALDPALEMLDGATKSPLEEEHQSVVGDLEEEEPPDHSHHNGHGMTLKRPHSQDLHNGKANRGLSEEDDRRKARSASLDSDTIRVAP
ncbi:hypothetical protein KVT40_003670 [Elsinoe batatas]|uniref:Uncharacterized protein n=1 Tax=Elsinoe batatas TaxID=2601811 RepID=A0A8K0PGQ9_9PEZI|nr:hypothetical protein KVT40_003670 [Elsinoe batatas]